jgi:nucleotide-binding universal stress UspA family protein
MSAPDLSQRESLVAPEAAQGILDRVLCGVDATPESLEAVRQGARLRAPDGSLTVVSAVDIGLAAEAGWAATPVAAQMEEEAERALEAARSAAPEATFRAVEGRPTTVLLAEARRLQATLLALGSHGYRRGIGIALGGVSTTMLHEAPCSVLIARPPLVEADFPRSIVVGIDGSPQSAAATAVAFALGDRFGVEVWPVAGRGGKNFDVAAVQEIATGVLLEGRRPVDLLVRAARDSDLLVVGSRGLHGVRALGSVSERVAHRARCSVLVVRPPEHA